MCVCVWRGGGGGDTKSRDQPILLQHTQKVAEKKSVSIDCPILAVENYRRASWLFYKGHANFFTQCSIVSTLWDQFFVQLISLDFEQSVESVWFVRCRSIALKQATRTNHMLPTDCSKSSEINCTMEAIASL